MISLIPMFPQLCRVYSLSRMQESNHPYYCCSLVLTGPNSLSVPPGEGLPKTPPWHSWLCSTMEYQEMASIPPLDDFPCSPGHLSTLHFVTRIGFALWAIFFSPAHKGLSPSCSLIFLCSSFKVLRDKTPGVTLSTFFFALWLFQSGQKTLVFPYSVFHLFSFCFSP